MLTVLMGVHLILRSDSGVLLQRRRGTKYHDGEFAFVGGSVEAGEFPSNAMVRETLEEIGIGIERDHLVPRCVCFRIGRDGVGKLDVFFECRVWTGTPRVCEPERSDLLKWVSPQHLPRNTHYLVNAVLTNQRCSRVFFEI